MILIRIILFGLLVYFGIKVISRVIRLLGSTSVDRRKEASGHQAAANDMVKDPVCGMYISMRDAITLNRRGGTLYFCSEECRRRYTQDKE